MTSPVTELTPFQRVGAPAIFVILWSSGFIGAKFGLPFAEPLTFLLWRYGMVTGLFVAWALLQKAPWPGSVRQVMHIATAGVLVNAVYIGGVFCAISHGLPAGIVSLIVGLQPLFTAVIATRLLGEKVYGRQWGGFILGLVGLLLVVGDKVSFGGGSAAGVIFALVALFGITAGTLYQKRYCASMDLRSGGVIQFAACTLVMAAAAPFLEAMNVIWSGRFIFALVWLVLFLSVGAVTLLNILIRRGEASRVASLFYLVPPATTLFAFLVFGERLGLAALFGMAVSVTGVALATRQPSPPVVQAPVEWQEGVGEEQIILEES